MFEFVCGNDVNKKAKKKRGTKAILESKPKTKGLIKNVKITIMKITVL